MIPYSVSMRANPANDQEPKKAYATAQCTEVMDLTTFAKHIASHGSTYSRADIAAVLTLAVDCLRENLLAGKRINLGELGTFFVTLQSQGQETMEKFTALNITAVNVNWSPGAEFVDLLDEATFEPVPTREAAAKLLKAQKAGETTVDITPSSTTTSGGTSGDSSDSDSSSDSGSSDSDSGSSDSGDSGNSGSDDDVKF